MKILILMTIMLATTACKKKEELPVSQPAQKSSLNLEEGSWKRTGFCGEVVYDNPNGDVLSTPVQDLTYLTQVEAQVYFPWDSTFGGDYTFDNGLMNFNSAVVGSYIGIQTVDFRTLTWDIVLHNSDTFYIRRYTGTPPFDTLFVHRFNR
jgi:hypothetical protein